MGNTTTTNTTMQESLTIPKLFIPSTGKYDNLKEPPSASQAGKPSGNPQPCRCPGPPAPQESSQLGRSPASPTKNPRGKQAGRAHRSGRCCPCQPSAVPANGRSTCPGEAAGIPGPARSPYRCALSRSSMPCFFSLCRTWARSPVAAARCSLPSSLWRSSYAPAGHGEAAPPGGGGFSFFFFLKLNIFFMSSQESPAHCMQGHSQTGRQPQTPCQSREPRACAAGGGATAMLGGCPPRSAESVRMRRLCRVRTRLATMCCGAVAWRC